MLIKIEPAYDAPEPEPVGYRVTVNGWGTGATYRTYEGACRVANAISDEAIRPKGEAVTIDFSGALAVRT